MQENVIRCKYNFGNLTATLREFLEQIFVPDPAYRLSIKQITDSAALEALIDSVLQANTKSVEEFRAGKEKAFNALVGQVMKASQGKANPQQLNELLRQKLQRS